jgi:uncharacterized flavoprotein (TIGR03862 family)
MDEKRIEKPVVIIGGGLAGLMAADVLSSYNISVTIIDSQKRVGKKFLIAGKGGLNLTHSENLSSFYTRYQDPDWAEELISQFTPQQLVLWMENLGIKTFVGSSGRVFPEKTYTPAFVLKSWVEALKKQGVQFELNTSLTKTSYPYIHVNQHGKEITLNPKNVIFAMGGKSWPQTGSDGIWESWFNSRSLLPSNVGLNCHWSDYFLKKHEGAVLKYVAVSYGRDSRLGDVIVTKKGLESTPIYHISNKVVKSFEKEKAPIIYVDLKPQDTIKQLLAKVKPNDSWQSCLKKWKLHPIQKDLLVDIFGKKFISQDELAEKIKKIPITIVGHESFDQAISTQGGVKKTNLNQDLSFKKHPKWFAAGEMLDQDGPTGGYLIQHAISSGFVAAKGIISQQKGT